MYSKEVIQTLLTAADFCNSPRNLVSTGETPHRYYYPHQAVTTETLLQDQCEYVVTQKEKIRNHCVIFLLKSDSSPYAAVIIYLSDIDENARNELLTLFSEATEKRIVSKKSFSYQELSEKQRLALSSLYRRVQCSLVGSVQEIHSPNTWKGYLQEVYIKAVCQINKQPINANQQAGIIFTESLLRLGQQKPVGVMNAQQIMSQHEQLCHGLLRCWWLDIQRNQPAIFTQIETLTRKLLKYLMLKTWRLSYAVAMLTASYDQLNTLILQDQTQKSHIYASPLPDIFTPLNQLSFSMMIGFLAYRQPANLPGLIQLLQNECQKEQAEIKKWETDLAKLLSDSKSVYRRERVNFASHPILLAAQHAYHCSFTGLEPELTPMLALGELAYFLAPHIYQYSFIGLGAELMPILALWGLEVFGLNDYLIDNFTPEQQYSLFTAIKWLGGGLGAAYTLWGGGYSLANSILIGNVSHWLDSFLQTSRLDDSTATVRKPFPLGKMGLSNVLRMGVGALESVVYRRSHYLTAACGGVLGSIGGKELGMQSLISGRPHYVMTVLGGALGSIGSMKLDLLIYGETHYLTAVFWGVLGSRAGWRLGTRWLTQNASPQQSSDIATTLLLCSLFGYEVGDRSISTIHQGMDKLITREALSEAFCQFTEQRGYQGCRADFPVTSAWSPSFWMKDQDATVRLSWYNTRGFQETECDIVPLTNGNHSVICDFPEVATIKRLGQ